MPAQRKVTPITRSVLVSWSVEAAYRRFTEAFGEWWPMYTHSIGGRRVRRVVFEARPGGQIYEEHHDGTRYLWGCVTALEPPRRVTFTWRASYEEADAQHIDVMFSAEGSGTRVALTSTGWERMSDHAGKAHDGYELTWTAVLHRFAGRFHPLMLFFGAMQAGIDLIGQRQTFMRNSLGRVPPAP